MTTDSDHDSEQSSFSLCPHVEYVDTLIAARKILNPTAWYCHSSKGKKGSQSDCGENSLMLACLSCGYISCVEEDFTGHARVHCYRKRRGPHHCIAMDINSLIVFCFECGTIVDNDTPSGAIEVFLNSFRALQRNDADTNTSYTRSGRRFRNSRMKATDDVVMVSSRRAKEFERRDKTENADAHYNMMLLRRAFNSWKIQSEEDDDDSRARKRKRDDTESDDSHDNEIKKRLAVSKQPSRKRSKRNSSTKNFAGRTGLRNLGNTCYFNSSVQCLNSTHTFRTLFLNLPAFVPENANVAPLPATPDTRTKRQRPRPRTTQTSKVAARTKAKKRDSNSRRQSARLHRRTKSTVDTDSDGDSMEMERGFQGDDSAHSVNSDLLMAECFDPSPIMGPSPALLRRSTTVLHHTMENAEEFKQDHPVSLSAEVYSLLRLFDSGKYACITPQRLAYSIWNTVPQFRSYLQQDAQEFVSLFLERLEQEIKGFDVDSADSSNSSLFDDDDGESVLRQRPSECIKRSFDSCLVSITECNECGNKSHYKSPGNKCVSLDIYGTIRRLLLSKKEDLEREQESNSNTKRKSGRRGKLRYGNGSKLTLRHLATDSAFNRALKSYGLCTLTDLLESTVSTVQFEGENQYFCEQCDRKVDAVKQDYYYRLPNVLIFHLCRAYYNVNSDKREKLQNKIVFPLTDLRMDRYSLEGEDTESDLVYDLVAALVHTGRSMNRGHYIAYCYRRDTQRWLKFDDVRVTITSEKTVRESKAYLLVYEKQDVDSRLDTFLRDTQQHIGMESLE